MKDLITIGLPSKGRLKDKAISFFNDKGLKILQSEKERNYFWTIKNENNIKIIFLHAKEIIQRLGDGTLDVGVSGLDLLKESDKNLQNKINIQKKLNQDINFIANFGRDVEYYTGIVFEVFSGKKEIARGGRYDDLLKSLGAKKNTPAVGAAINLKNI